MSVSFTYTLDPPSSASATPVPKTGSQSFELQPASTTEEFYRSSAAALRDAQTALMGVLTAWKDAVGDEEKHKENTGKAAFGKGKANRMMAANRAAEESDTESSESE